MNMKKFVAIILTLAIMLSFTIPAAALTKRPETTDVTAISEFISENYHFLSESSRSVLADIKPLLANWGKMPMNQRQQAKLQIDKFIAQAKNEISQKRAALFAFRETLNGLFVIIRENNVLLEKAFNDIKDVKGEIRRKLNYIKENDPDYDLDEVIAAFTALKSLYEDLNDTKGDIREIIIANKKNMKDLNEELITVAFNEIIVIQENRLDILGEIKTVLDKINDEYLSEIPVALTEPTATPEVTPSASPVV